jgi:hypothetical protein
VDKNTDIIIGITAPPRLIAIVVVYVLIDEAAKPDLSVSLALTEITDTCDLTFLMGNVHIT